MKIVYYTSGISGTGRIVRGISIGNALNRKGIACNYTILSSSATAFPAIEFNHIEIPAEKEQDLSKASCRSSHLYNSLIKLNPDILIIDLLWVTVYHFINELPCKKIFLLRNVSERFFSLDSEQGKLAFNPEDYDAVYVIEPVKSFFNFKSINPVIIKNREEILSRSEAMQKLKINTDRPICLFAFNGTPEESAIINNKYSYLDNEYYTVYPSIYKDKGLFPVVDYFNAFDFIISGAGYNQFWEIIYFNKEAVFEPMPRKFEDQAWRVQNCQENYFDENGADQLVDILMDM